MILYIPTNTYKYKIQVSYNILTITTIYTLYRYLLNEDSDVYKYIEFIEI